MEHNWEFVKKIWDVGATYKCSNCGLEKDEYNDDGGIDYWLCEKYDENGITIEPSCNEMVMRGILK